MNDSGSLPGASLLPESTDLITTMHLVLILLFAVAAMAIIGIGIVRKRRRKEAEHAFEERVEEAESERDAAPSPPPSAPVPAPSASPPLPVAYSTSDDTPASPAPLQDEPVAAAAPLAASPAGEAIASDPAGSGSHTTADDLAEAPLTILKGLGPKVAARLDELGFARVDHLAALSDAEAARVDADLGPFAGRMARDRWVEQARLLAAGDRSGFEAAFGRL